MPFRPFVRRTMVPRRTGLERIRAAVAAADAEEPLTARQIVAAVEEYADDADIDSPHRVATILGRASERGAVDVIRDQPYRYRVSDTTDVAAESASDDAAA
jgi:hypothetical protein